MIPKRLIYVWLNDKDASTPLMEKCLNSWRRVMPDYDVMRIDLGNVNLDSRYLREALKVGNWVIASVYLRFKYLYDYGGIYLDTDVEVLKRFDPLLGNACFFGSEDFRRVAIGVIGSEPGHWFMWDYLEALESCFKGDRDQKFADLGGVGLATQLLVKHGWRHRDENIRVRDIQIYESKYFYPFHYTQEFSPVCITRKTYAIHWWAGKKGWAKPTS